MCEAMKSFQVVFWLRFGGGWIPYRRRMLATVWSETELAKIGKGSDDMIISPAGVLSGEADDKRFKLRVDAGPAR